jgi:predicted HTH transcriptional regulator
MRRSHLAPGSTPTLERLIRCAWRIYCGGEVSAKWIRTRFGVSDHTAKRDLNRLMKTLPIKTIEPPRKGKERRLILAKIIVKNLGD